MNTFTCALIALIWVKISPFFAKLFFNRTQKLKRNKRSAIFVSAFLQNYFFNRSQKRKRHKRSVARSCQRFRRGRTSASTSASASLAASASVPEVAHLSDGDLEEAHPEEHNFFKSPFRPEVFGKNF
jgi:hypothetical protein